VNPNVGHVPFSSQETFAADLAFVGQISGVASGMSVEFATIAETLFTHLALVRSLARVPAKVRHVAFVPHEAFVAIAASEREVSGVSASVSDELIAIPEGLVAELAGVPLVVALVDAKVLGQVLTLRKRFLADFAAVRPNAVLVILLAGLRTHDDRLTGVERDGGDHRAVV